MESSQWSMSIDRKVVPKFQDKAKDCSKDPKAASIFRYDNRCGCFKGRLTTPEESGMKRLNGREQFGQSGWLGAGKRFQNG